MSGTSGNVRRRAGASAKDSSDDTTTREELSIKNAAAVAASRGGVSRQADVQMAILLRLVAILLMIIILFAVSRVSMKGKEIEKEPLPTLTDLESIIANWEKEFVLASAGDDGEENSDITAADEFDALGGQLPVGPIPHRLWLPDCEQTSAKKGFRSVQPEKQCKENVKNTIKKYHNAWQQERLSAAQMERRAQANVRKLGSYSEVKYLTDGECLLLIELAKQELLAPFRVEQNNDYKYDICRIAALYLYGGYYFDVEVQVMEPVIPKGTHEDVSFITAVEASGNGFFEAFVASTAKHPILKRTLDKMTEYYEDAYVEPGSNPEEDDFFGKEADDDDDPATREMLEEEEDRGDDDSTKLGYINAMVAQAKTEEDPSWKLGTRTLKDAFVSLTPEARGETMLLQEINLDPPEEHGHWYSEVERRRDLPQQQCCCNYVVHDPRTRTPHLYSRVKETTYC